MNRICFVIPTLKVGGTELFLLRLCALAQFRYSVTVIVIGKREGLAFDYEKLNIGVVYLEIESVTRFLPALIRLRLAIKNVEPDVIHSFLYIADILTGLASIGLHIPIKIWSLRGTKLATKSGFRRYAIQKIAVFLSRLIPNQIIACSEQARDYHVGIGYPKKKIVCIGNTLPQWVASAEPNSVLLKEDKPKVISVGLAARFDLGKGHIALAQTVAFFLNENPNLQVILKFAGKGCIPRGPLANAIMADEVVAKQLDCKSLVVEFCGLIPFVDMGEWYCSIDLYFMASDDVEGFPNSLAEAVAAGVPSLANPGGAASDFLPPSQISRSSTVSDMKDNLESFYLAGKVERVKTSAKQKKYMQEKFLDSKVLQLYSQAWDCKGITK